MAWLPPFLSLDNGVSNVERAQNLEQVVREALKEARSFREDEARVKAVGEQLAQAGQLAEDATDNDKLRAAEKMIDEQIAQMDQQISKLNVSRARKASNS